MNSYELSRSFFDWAFENPEKIKPNHIALYFFCIEHCNRLGWKEKFGLPSAMAKEAIGIKSYNTYIQTLNDLVDWGFVEMVQKSKNQHTSNIIALSKFNKALDKALDKALIKHTTKQRESIDSIDKQINKEQENKEQGVHTHPRETEFSNFFEPTKENLHHLKQQGLMKGISEDEIDAFILNMNGNGWTYTRANNVYPFKDLQQVFLKMWDWKTTGILTDRVKKIKKAALNGSYTNTPEQVNGERFEVIETPNGWEFSGVQK